VILEPVPQAAEDEIVVHVRHQELVREAEVVHCRKGTRPDWDRRDFVALHMTWGAINELTTLMG
jgi:hypothetical protein